jgi:tetratricopeptide (TPR) repeat protein
VPALADSLAVAADIALARAAHPQAVEYARQTIQVREKAIAARGSADELEVRLLGDYRRLTRALDRAGRKSEALTQAEAARKKVKDVLARRGNDVAVLRHAALADYEQGDLLLASARLEEAQRSFESGLASARQLGASEAGNVRYQQDIAEGAAKLGDVHQRRSDAPAAMAQYREALKILEPLTAANPDLVEVPSALAGIHSRLGGVFAVQRVFADAADEYRKASDILEVLAAKQPSNPDTQFEYASAMRRQAETLLMTGPENKLEALTLLQRALDHVTRHLPDPTSPRVMALRTEIERVKTEAMK